jgi:hypothetical protein
MAKRLKELTSDDWRTIREQEQAYHQRALHCGPSDPEERARMACHRARRTTGRHLGGVLLHGLPRNRPQPWERPRRRLVGLRGQGQA